MQRKCCTKLRQARPLSRAAAPRRILLQPLIPRRCCEALGRVHCHYTQARHVLGVPLHVIPKLRSLEQSNVGAGLSAAVQCKRLAWSATHAGTQAPSAGRHTRGKAAGCPGSESIHTSCGSNSSHAPPCVHRGCLSARGCAGSVCACCRGRSARHVVGFSVSRGARAKGACGWQAA